MTAEETLEKHLTPMLKREPRSYQLISEMKETPEWNVTIQAMEAYKDAELKKAREKIKELEYVINKMIPKDGLGKEEQK